MDGRSSSTQYESPKMGRVRVFTQYFFTVWGSGQDEQLTASIVDWHKRGEGWAKGQVMAAVRGHFPKTTDPWVGRPSKEQIRIRPYAGQQVEIPTDADQVQIW